MARWFKWMLPDLHWHVGLELALRIRKAFLRHRRLGVSDGLARGLMETLPAKHLPRRNSLIVFVPPLRSVTDIKGSSFLHRLTSPAEDSLA